MTGSDCRSCIGGRNFRVEKGILYKEMMPIPRTGRHLSRITRINRVYKFQ